MRDVRAMSEMLQELEGRDLPNKEQDLIFEELVFVLLAGGGTSRMTAPLFTAGLRHRQIIECALEIPAVTSSTRLQELILLVYTKAGLNCCCSA